MQALTEQQQRDIVQAHKQGTEQRALAAQYGVSRATISRVVSRAERRAVESLQAQTIGPKAIDPQTGASFEVADEDLLRSLARCLARDFQQTGNITERANIARTIAQLVQTRHKIAQLQLARQIGKLSTVAACSMHDSQPDEATVIFSDARSASQ